MGQAYADKLRAATHHNGADKKRGRATEDGWMKKLHEGDYSGPTLDRSRYLNLRGESVKGNPRQTDEYQKMCQAAVGVGEEYDQKRYSHLQPADIGVIRWV